MKTLVVRVWIERPSDLYDTVINLMYQHGVGISLSGDLFDNNTAVPFLNRSVHILRENNVHCIIYDSSILLMHHSRKVLEKQLAEFGISTVGRKWIELDTAANLVGQLPDIEIRPRFRYKGVLALRLQDLPLSVRAYNALRQSNSVGQLGDMLILTEEQLLRKMNFGRKSLNEVKDLLQLADASLRPGMSLEQVREFNKSPANGSNNTLARLKK